MVAEVDRLLDDHTEAGVAAELNRLGFTSGTDQAFNSVMVSHIRRSYKLAPRHERLRSRGFVSLEEAATHMGLHPSTVKNWRREGRLVAEPLNDKGEHYYQLPAVTPRKAAGRPPGTKNRPKPITVRTNPGGAV